MFLLRIAVVLAASLSIHAADQDQSIQPVTAAKVKYPELSTQPKWMAITPYRASQIAFVGATVSDIASSWNCYEANPVLRSADGRFRTQGLAIKAGATAGSLIAAHFLKKKFPKLEKPLAFMFGGTSTLLYGVALRNNSMPACH